MTSVTNTSKYYTSKKRTMTAMDKVIAKALSGTLVVEDEFIIDSKTGYNVRVFNQDAPCTRADVRELLLNNRVVTLEDIYSIVGKNVFAYMTKKGYLKQHATSLEMFWVTESASKQYDLPKVMNCDFPA